MIEPGQKAPHFTLADQDGQPLSLSALWGKPVMVHSTQMIDSCG